PPAPVTQNQNHKIPSDWSRNGILVYTEIDPKTGADIWYVDLTADEKSRKPVPFLQTQFHESFGQISPDGHWMAYLSNESGPWDVFIRSFPSGSRKWKVSSSSGISGTTQQPRWNANSKELFYVSAAGGRFTMVSASIVPHIVNGGEP